MKERIQLVMYTLVLQCYCAIAQVPDVVKSVTLDSVVIEAVRTGGFRVEDFIDKVRTDTTFYKGYSQGLRYR
jgi:hypothetical protein